MRAYLPPQKLDRGTLDISVIEGKMGDLTVSGNHHYKTFLFKKKFYELKKSEPFNFNKLTKIVRKINEQPDRTAKAVIVPGKEPGSTDVELQVKDSLPIHAAVDFDNYASVYLFYNRYQMGGVDNNFLGFEDILNVKYMMCEASSYESLSASYLIPITNTMKFGAYGSTARLRLINDAKPLDIYGKSRIMSFYVNQSIVDYENAAFSVDLGFDYKNVYNYQLNNETSRDKMRIAKVSFNLDITDLVGRTILTNEVDIGLPGFMNGSDAKDARTSRPGAGGEFVKYVVNLLRLQQMPLDSNILWTNQLQVSSKPLTATEEYQLGGIANLRGYPPAELVGDYGLTTSVEWAFPPYFIPKNIKIPFAGTKFYDAIRIVAFYDYGNVRLKRPLGNEKKNNQLSDVGWGFRVNLPKMLTMRFDFAWALDKKPSDGSNEHTWVAIAGRF